MDEEAGQGGTSVQQTYRHPSEGNPPSITISATRQLLKEAMETRWQLELA